MRIGGAGTQAVLVGSSTYSSESALPNLPSVAGNLGRLHDFLLEQGVPGENVRVILDPLTTLSIATNLKAACQAPGDVLFFYYSGHGLLDSRQRLHLSLRTSLAQYVPETSMLFSRVRELIVDAVAPVRVVILDCCFAGAALDWAMGVDVETVVEAQAGVRGAYTLLSSDRDATSLAPPGRPLTAFTGTLMTILETGVEGGPRDLTLREIQRALHRELTIAGYPPSRAQEDDIAGDLILSSNRRWRPLPESGISRGVDTSTIDLLLETASGVGGADARFHSAATGQGHEPLVDAEASRESQSARGWSALEQQGARVVAAGELRNPHALLGPHPTPDDKTRIRAFLPEVDSASVVTNGAASFEMTRVPGSELFVCTLDGGVTDYRIRCSSGSAVDVRDDPYRYPPSADGAGLIASGAEALDHPLWRTLGAHVLERQDSLGPTRGTAFRVWAPAARGVRVAGDFDGWSGRGYPMRQLTSGLWELFVPGVDEGARYVFKVLAQSDEWSDKIDPFARAMEAPPSVSCIVASSRSSFPWKDQDWMRGRVNYLANVAPLAIYEVHLGSWRAGLSYRDLADELVAYVREMGFTHVELLPVAEHPSPDSLGFGTSAYYAPTARFGDPDDFRYLVNKLHQGGIGIIMDWVPAHFPKDAWGLGRFDGTPLFEHPSRQLGERPLWNAYVFDFGRLEVRRFLVENALFWITEYHIDALRVNAVASILYLDYDRADADWTPNALGGRENLDGVSFLQETTARVHRESAGIFTLADEAEAWPNVTGPTSMGGLGFGMKLNVSWAAQSVRFVCRRQGDRAEEHDELTKPMMSGFAESYVLALSHEQANHPDGQLVRRIPGDLERRLAVLRALYGYMWAHPGKKSLFMGLELAQDEAWNPLGMLDWSLLLDPLHNGVRQLVADLNRLSQTYSDIACWDRDPAGFLWADTSKAWKGVVSLCRRGSESSTVVVAVNLSDEPIAGYQMQVPVLGSWVEVLNTSWPRYVGGSDEPARSYSVRDKTPASSGYLLPAIQGALTVDLPALASIWLAPSPGAPK